MDTDKLKRLAEAAIEAGCKDWPMVEYYDLALPHTVLALIAENEQFRLLNEEYVATRDRMHRAIDKARDEELAAQAAERQRDEAVALLRGAKSYVSIAASESDLSYNPARDVLTKINSYFVRTNE